MVASASSSSPTAGSPSGGPTTAKPGIPGPAGSWRRQQEERAAQEQRARLQEEWASVQKELEADKKRRADEARERALQNGGQASLFEALQANKAAKQAAFDEKHAIKNQFRGLDDDDVDYLDDVRERMRADEERRRRETEEELAAFRAARRGGGGDEDGSGDDKKDGGDAPLDNAPLEKEVEAAVEEWVGSGPGRKRKRERDKDAGGLLKGIKRRASDITGDDDKKEQEERREKAQKTGNGSLKAKLAMPAGGKIVQGKDEGSRSSKESPKQSAPASAGAATKQKLGLVDYGSDSD